MKFSRLRASIENNADETPSVYMALCMVESLLDDMEDVTGQEISDLPIGDDTLPTKMVWLCQVISQIHKEKNGEFARNRNRLDTAMRDLEKASTELEAFSETADRLAEVKTDLKKRQAALKRARADQEEYETIKEQCRQLQLEAESLGSFDKAAEEAKLRDLQAETADLAQTRSDLDARLTAVRAEWNEIVEKTADLRSEIDKTVALTKQKSIALSGMEQQQQKAQMRERELTNQLQEATEALSALQDAVTLLETEKLPERNRQRGDEEARKKSLEQTLESLKSETEQIREKNVELSSKIAEAQEELDTHNSVYSRLTEDYRQKSEEIAILVQRLEELQGKNDAQKHEIYRRQRKEQIAELERMGEECAALEQELTELEQDVRARQHEEEELRERIAQAEDVKQKISDVMRELEPIASEDSVIKLEENRQRLEMLETVRGNLSGTLSDIQEILGIMPVSDNGVSLDRMKGALQGLLNYTDKLQKNLVQYAKSVALEEGK